jgi:hypothetical protein
MADYSVVLARSASPSLSVGNINVTSTLRRVHLFDFIIGHEAAGDSPFAWLLQRTTANGTRTAYTPQPTNPADGASSFAAGENHTVDATYEANKNMLRIPLNQRGAMRWVAAKESAQIVIPAVLDAGLGVKTPVAGAVAVSTTLQVTE